MKKYYYLLVFFILPLYRCNLMHDTSGRVCIAIAFDATDSLKATMDVDTGDIRRLIPIEHNPQLGAWVRLSYISDVKATEAYIHELESHSAFGSNSYERAGESKRFFAELMYDMDAIRSQVRKRERSYVFHQLIASMDALAECSDCTRKLCIVVSDLGENSSLFSIYKTAEKAKLNKHPDMVMADIEKEYPQAKRYNDITVTVVHTSDTKNDQNFWCMYTKLVSPYLANRGAHVSTVGSVREIR